MKTTVSFPDLSEVIATANRHMRTHRACLVTQCPAAQIYVHMQHMIHGLMISNNALAKVAAPQLDNIAIIVAQGKQLDALQDEFANAHSFHYITAMENKALRLENQRLTRALNGLTTGNQAYVYALGQNTLRNL